MDIVNEKTEGRQHTVFKENWSTGKMEPIQSKDNQAISFGGSTDCPGQAIHIIRKKMVLWTLSVHFSFPNYKRFTNLPVLMAVLGRPCSRSQPMHASRPLEHPRPAATAGHSLTIQPYSR